MVRGLRFAVYAAFACLFVAELTLTSPLSIGSFDGDQEIFLDRSRRAVSGNRSSSSRNKTMQVSVEIGKGSGNKANISHPKQLLPMHPNATLTVIHNTSLPRGRSLIKMRMSIYGVPLFDRDIIVVEDPSEDIQYELAKNPFLKEINSLANVLFSKPVPWLVSSYALCRHHSNLTEDPELLFNSTRHIHFNETTGTLSFADNIVVTHKTLPHVKQHCLVDASNGTIIDSFDGINTYSYPGGNAGTGRRQVQLDLPTDDSGNCKLMSDDGLIRVIDARNGASFDASPMSFDCDDGPNDEINRSYGPAVDCFYYTMKTRECVASKVRGSPDLAAISPDGIVRVFVHYNQGNNQMNAMWNGRAAYVGDGDGVNAYNFCTHTIVAHELGHGIVSQFSQLTGGHTEPGCMNEAFGDITGMMVRSCSEGEDSLDWKNDMALSARQSFTDQVVRDLSEPATNRVTIKQWSDYHGSANTEEHTCSGLYGHAFYIMATAPGWDIYKAYNVMYGGNQLWSSRTTMAAGACDVLTYAHRASLSGSDLETISSAFQSVGIQIPDSCSTRASRPTAPITATPGTNSPKATINPLPNCQSVTGLSGDDNSFIFFKAEVDDSATVFQVTTRLDDDAQGEIYVYVNYGRLPQSIADKEHADITGSASVTITLTCPNSGDYYIIIYGKSAFSGLGVKACATSSSSSGGDDDGDDDDGDNSGSCHSTSTGDD